MLKFYLKIVNKTLNEQDAKSLKEKGVGLVVGVEFLSGGSVFSKRTNTAY
jgi:hypothetical protein